MNKILKNSQSWHFLKESMDSQKTPKSTITIKHSNSKKLLTEVELSLPPTFNPAATIRPVRSTFTSDKYGNLHPYEEVIKNKETGKKQAKSRIVTFRRDLNEFVELQHKNKKDLISKLGKDLFCYKNSWVHEDYKYNEELLRQERLKQVKSKSSNDVIGTINSNLNEVREEDESSKSRYQSQSKITKLKLSTKTLGGAGSIDIDTRKKFVEERLKLECKFNQHKKIVNLLNRSGKINNLYSKVQQEIYGNKNSIFKANAKKNARQRIVSLDFNNGETPKETSKSQKKLFSNNVLVTELRSKQVVSEANVKDVSFNDYLQVDPNMFINTEIEYLISKAAKKKEEEKRTGLIKLDKPSAAFISDRVEKVNRRRNVVMNLDNSLHSLSYEVSNPDLEELTQHIEHKAYKAFGRKVNYKDYNRKFHYIEQIVHKNQKGANKSESTTIKGLQTSTSLNKIMAKSKSKDVLVIKSKYLNEKLNRPKQP